MPVRGTLAARLRIAVRVPALLALGAWTLACASGTRTATESSAEPGVPAALRAEVASAILAAPEALHIEAGTEDAPRALLGPMVGLATDTSARFWLQVDRPGRVEATLTADGGGRATGGAEARAEDGNIVVVHVGGLAPATR